MRDDNTPQSEASKTAIHENESETPDATVIARGEMNLRVPR